MTAAPASSILQQITNSSTDLFLTKFCTIKMNGIRFQSQYVIFEQKCVEIQLLKSAGHF
jgi:hypothetical protein